MQMDIYGSIEVTVEIHKDVSAAYISIAWSLKEVLDTRGLVLVTPR